MTELINISNKLNSIVKNWDKWTTEFLHKFDADFVDLNVEQMLDGEMANGEIIGELKSQEYIQLKKSRGSKAAPLADLKLTGDFQRLMKIDYDFNITSTDSKTTDLVRKYSSDIFGVEKTRLEQFTKDQIVPEFQVYFLKEIGL